MPSTTGLALAKWAGFCAVVCLSYFQGKRAGREESARAVAGPGEEEGGEHEESTRLRALQAWVTLGLRAAFAAAMAKTGVLVSTVLQWARKTAQDDAACLRKIAALKYLLKEELARVQRREKKLDEYKKRYDELKSKYDRMVKYKDGYCQGRVSVLEEKREKLEKAYKKMVSFKDGYCQGKVSVLASQVEALREQLARQLA